MMPQSDGMKESCQGSRDFLIWGGISVFHSDSFWTLPQVVEKGSSDIATGLLRNTIVRPVDLKIELVDGLLDKKYFSSVGAPLHDCSPSRGLAPSWVASGSWDELSGEHLRSGQT